MALELIIAANSNMGGMMRYSRLRLAARKRSLVGLAGLCPLGALLFMGAAALAVEPGHVSRTAMSACAYRAIGANDPDPKTRNPDYLAEKILGGAIDFESAIQAIRRMLRHSYFFVTARTKHIDALLTQEIKRGATQVVILGAGFDSRAYRFHERFPKVRFFELDLPAAQQYKRDLFAVRIGPPPDTLIYTPIDFNTQTLSQVLAKAGYDPKAKTFFIWEGVTYYICGEAVDGTLRFIAGNSGSGSSVVFDYTMEEVIKGDYSRFPKAKQGMEWLASLGEPWVFGIADGQSPQYMGARGLRIVSDLTAKQMSRRYLIGASGKPIGPLPQYMRIMHAAVEPAR